MRRNGAPAFPPKKNKTRGIRVFAALFSVALSAAGCATSGLQVVEGERIDLSAASSGSGVIAADLSGRPKGRDGILKTFSLRAPTFKRGVCFALGNAAKWPAGANRVMPWILDGDAGKLRRGALFLLLELRNGRYMALLPIACPDAMSWFETDGAGALRLASGTLGTAPFEGTRPVLSWSVSDNPYAACAKAWRAGLEAAGGNASPPRWEKAYPEIFRYLGWCSWEQYHKKINAAVLLKAADGLEKVDVPVRWMLVDDGHEALEGGGLRSFVPDGKKFPDGWAPLLAHRSKGKLKWFGLWHCDQGYWGGIAAENDFGGLKRYLERLPSGIRMPKPSAEAIERFYEAYMASVAEYGFDFVKIDNQAATLARYRGVPNAVAAATEYAVARERAAARYFDGALINCMAHNAVCAFRTVGSAATRCSVDYSKGAVLKGKRHIWQSFMNTLWLGQTVWPDHDMFHSSDPACGALMAISKALSGGPVYLSDEPADIRTDLVSPLCLEDGELLRPEAPGFPLPDSIFIDPIYGGKCFRVVAPLPHRSAAVALFDLLGGPGKTLEGLVEPGDYCWRGGLSRGFAAPEGIPPEGLVAYDWRAGKGRVLDKPWKIEMKGFSCELVIIAPVVDGWAVIGRSDKYLSTAAVENIAFSQKRLSVTLKEPGPLVVYSAKGAPAAEGAAAIPLGGGFFRFDIPRARKGPFEITR